MKRKVFQWLVAGMVFFALTACSTNTMPDQPSESQALETIVSYVENGGEAPEASDYRALGIDGVASDNVDEVNALVRERRATESETIRQVVEQRGTALEKIRHYADSKGATSPPTGADYAALGVTGVTGENLAAVNVLVASKKREEVDSRKEVQALVNGLMSEEEEDTTPPTIVTEQEHYQVGDLIRVTVGGPLSGDEDWVGIYPAGASNDRENVLVWNWVSKAGTVRLDKERKEMPAGVYEVRLFFHNTTDKEEAKNRFDVVYHYGEMGQHTVAIAAFSKNSKAVVYHPEDWGQKPTPVIFFSPGWHSTDHTKYNTLLKFIASHGYSVIYEPDDKDTSRQDQLGEFDDIVKEFEDKLNTDLMGVLGHSSGGGFVYKILEHMSAKEYGARNNKKNSRFLLTMDGYFAEYMDKANMENLKDTNVIFIQFGNTGNGTDPRIVLVNYNLLSGENIDKNYIVVTGDHAADHSYPEREKISDMQGLLKPLDALMEYTFTTQSPQNHTLALEGPGKDNPYANVYQKVEEIDTYQYNCEYANKYHKGADGHTQSTIDNCGDPVIPSNNQ